MLVQFYGPLLEDQCFSLFRVELAIYIYIHFGVHRDLLGKGSQYHEENKPQN